MEANRSITTESRRIPEPWQIQPEQLDYLSAADHMTGIIVNREGLKMQLRRKMHALLSTRRYMVVGCSSAATEIRGRT